MSAVPTETPIRHVVAIREADGGASAVDTLALDHRARALRRRVLVAEGGTRALIDEPHAVTLAPGALIELDDGTLVRIRATEEPCHAIRPGDGASLLELAWHLGNRHAAMEIAGDELRIAHDPVLARMAENMGASVREIVAPFAPLRGAYHAHSHD